MTKYITSTNDERFWYIIEPQENAKYPYKARVHAYNEGALRCIDINGINLPALPEQAIQITQS